MSEDTPTAVLLFIYIIAFLIGFPSSALAFYSCIHKIHTKPLPIDIIMMNLVISDLMFLTFLPLKMKEAADNMVWNMPYILCYVHLFTFFLPIYSSCLFLAAISTERYVCVAFPVKYRSPRRILYTTIACVAIWMLAVSIAVLIYNRTSTDSNKAENITHTTANQKICYRNFSLTQLHDLLQIRLALAVLFFGIPLIICCFCYINAIRILLKLPLIKRHRRLRAIGLALGTLIVFAICFGPYNASHIVGYIRQQEPEWRMQVLMLTTLNAGFDPIIFYCISWKMRGAIKMCGKCLFQLFNCRK